MEERLAKISKVTLWSGVAVIWVTSLAAFTVAENVTGNEWAALNSLVFAVGCGLLVASFVTHNLSRLSR